MRISEESTADKIEEWSDQLEKSVRRFEEPMTIMQDTINQWKEKKAIENREEEKSKTKEAPRIGKIGDPTAELTKLGWIIISIEKESNYSHLLLKTSVFSNYEELCSLDAQGISEKEDANNESVLNKFKSQLLEKEGFYETELIWKEGNYKLENNKAGSLGRLNNLLKNLKQEPDKSKEYDDIIKSQLQEGLSR